MVQNSLFAPCKNLSCKKKLVNGNSPASSNVLSSGYQTDQNVYLSCSCKEELDLDIDESVLCGGGVGNYSLEEINKTNNSSFVCPFSPELQSTPNNKNYSDNKNLSLDLLDNVLKNKAFPSKRVVFSNNRKQKDPKVNNNNINAKKNIAIKNTINSSQSKKKNNKKVRTKPINFYPAKFTNFVCLEKKKKRLKPIISITFASLLIVCLLLFFLLLKKKNIKK